MGEASCNSVLLLRGTAEGDLGLNCIMRAHGKRFAQNNRHVIENEISSPLTSWGLVTFRAGGLVKVETKGWEQKGNAR